MNVGLTAKSHFVLGRVHIDVNLVKGKIGFVAFCIDVPSDERGTTSSLTRASNSGTADAPDGRMGA
jgi:hypothetical protein